MLTGVPLPRDAPPLLHGMTSLHNTNEHGPAFGWRPIAPIHPLPSSQALETERAKIRDLLQRHHDAIMAEFDSLVLGQIDEAMPPLPPDHVAADPQFMNGSALGKLQGESNGNEVVVNGEAQDNMVPLTLADDGLQEEPQTAKTVLDSVGDGTESGSPNANRSGTASKGMKSPMSAGRGVHGADECDEGVIHGATDQPDPAVGEIIRYSDTSRRDGGSQGGRARRPDSTKGANCRRATSSHCEDGQNWAGDDAARHEPDRRRPGAHPSFRSRCGRPNSIVINEVIEKYEYEQYDDSMLPEWKRMPFKTRRWRPPDTKFEDGNEWRYQPIPCIHHGRLRGPARLFTEVYTIPGLEQCTLDDLEDMTDPFVLNHEEQPTAIHIYTDGSKDSCGVGWAYVVMLNFGCDEDVVTYEVAKDGHMIKMEKQRHDRMHGFVYGKMDDEDSSYQAEVEAALQAMAWLHSYLEGIDAECKVLMHIDNEACLNITQLACDDKDDERAHMLMLAVRTCKAKFRAKHVKAHMQNPWNCLADAAAKHGRSGDSVAAMVGHAERWSGLSKDILNLQAIIDARRRGDGTMPPITGDGCDIMPVQDNANVNDIVEAFQRTRKGLKKKKVRMKLSVATYNVLSLRREGRSAALQKVLAEKAVDIVGIQEARTDGPSKRSAKDYIVLTSGHSEHHGHGCELWVRKIMTVNGREVAVTMANVHMIDASPRWLVARVCTDFMDCCVMVVHAPHAGHKDDEIKQFWNRLDDAVQKGRTDDCDMMLIGDYNHCPQAGDFEQCSNDPHHPADEFIQKYELWTPYMHRACNGDGGLKHTCYVNDGKSLIDHISLPTRWSKHGITAATDQDTDISLKKIDHIGMKCEITIDSLSQTVLTSSRQRLPYDLQKAKEDTQGVTEILESIPEVQWETHVDQHWQEVQQHVVGMLSEKYPRRAHAELPDWMKEDTYEKIKLKAGIFKTIVAEKRKENSDKEKIKRLNAEMKAAGNMVRQLVTRDKRTTLDDIAGKSVAAFNDGNAKEAYRQLKRLRPYKSRMAAPHKAVDEDIILCKEEHIQDDWLRYWADYFDGKICTFEEMVRNAQQVAPWDDYDKVLRSLPNVCELTHFIKKQKSGRQHGNDLIPAEIWKISATISAQKIYGLLLKVWMGGVRPLQWQGDIHVTIPKQAGKFRGVCLADSMAKITNGMVRSRLIQEVEDNAPVTAFGAIAGRGTDLAIHTRVMATQVMEKKGTSSAMLFVDLVAAFDEVNRSKLIGMLDLQDPVHRLVAVNHDNTWTTTIGSDFVATTNKGVKQGDPIADATFVMYIVPCLHAIARYAQQMGYQLNVASRNGQALHPGQAIQEWVQLTDISYIDDITAMICGDDADAIMNGVVDMCNAIHDIMQDYSFKLNVGKGKTEAVVRLCGRGSGKTKAALAKDGYVVSTKAGTLRIVDQYTHIGIVHAFENESNRVAAHVCRRMKMKAMEQDKIFRSRVFKEEHKQKAMAICLASALYGAAVWPTMTRRNIRAIETEYMKMMRRAYGQKFNPKHNEEHIVCPNDRQVRLFTRQASVQEIIYLRMLMYWPRFLIKAPVVLRAMVQEVADRPFSWPARMREALEWAWMNSDRLSELPNPKDDTLPWETLATSHPAEWKKIVGLLGEQANDGHCLGQCEEDPQHQGPEREEGEPQRWECQFCDEVYDNAQAAAMHMSTKHERVTWCSRMQKNQWCRWCFKDLGSRPRAVQHLKDSWSRRGYAGCAGQIKIWGLQPIGDDELVEALKADRELAKRNKARGLHPGRPEDKGRKHRSGPVRPVKYGPCMDISGKYADEGMA
eukprot:TRINITY_DN37820_c0_g2_i1.p1 TRINITY_DN37820_c0_g2~~TRINITY_DN37820_c0_g2_i1.p1  ORF type:complete len:1803 (+),score=349.39 TRINITY_DN37820_c0_g2_i1:54-5462(+)